MKFSDLQSRDNGHEVFFTALDGKQKFRIVMSRELLDDECGDAATEAERHAWVNTHMPGILDAMIARTDGGTIEPPYNRVFVEELD